jgi:hypothetical protein
VDDATTVDNLDIWLVLAQAQLVLVLFQVLVAVSVVLEVDSVVDSLLVEDLLADHVPLPATSAVALTTSLEIARHKP